MTYLSQATCARIASKELARRIRDLDFFSQSPHGDGYLPDAPVTDREAYADACRKLKLIYHPLIQELLSRDFLIAAFGEGKEVIPQPGDPTYYKFYDGTGMTLEMEPAWKHLGHRLLEVY